MTDSVEHKTIFDDPAMLTKFEEYDRILAEADQDFHEALHSEEAQAEELAPRGRPKKYMTQEEKTEAQRKNALLHYHRKKALCHYLKTAPELVNGDIFTVHVKFSSSRLGVVEEDVQYRVINKDKDLYQKLTH